MMQTRRVRRYVVKTQNTVKGVYTEIVMVNSMRTYLHCIYVQQIIDMCSSHIYFSTSWCTALHSNYIVTMWFYHIRRMVIAVIPMWTPLNTATDNIDKDEQLEKCTQ